MRLGSTPNTRFNLAPLSEQQQQQQQSSSSSSTTTTTTTTVEKLFNQKRLRPAVLVLAIAKHFVCSISQELMVTLTSAMRK